MLLASGLMLITLACLCGPLQQIQSIQTTVGAAQATIGPALTELKQNQPTFEAAATQLQLTLTAAGPEMTNAFGQLNTQMAGATSQQWASSAAASSQSGASDRSASQATGAPNTPQCGDHGTAWASSGTTTTETLTLTYVTAVIPTTIVITHSFNPSSVVKVEVADETGTTTSVYQGTPNQEAQCPFQQTIQVSLGAVTNPVNTVIITLDQSVIGNWDEIDAVQLVGLGQ
jgi:hypothetical protein